MITGPVVPCSGGNRLIGEGIFFAPLLQSYFGVDLETGQNPGGRLGFEKKI